MFNKLEWQRNRRIKTLNSDTKKYERTLKGHLMRMYRNMKSRIYGIQKAKAHLYEGKFLLNKEEFYEWALSHKEYKRLHNNWVKSGYDRKLCPTVDRINSSEGYTKDNIRWLTHSENSRLGCLSRFGKLI